MSNDIIWTPHPNFPDLKFGDLKQPDEYDPGYMWNDTFKVAVVFIADDPDHPSEVTYTKLIEGEMIEGSMPDSLIFGVLYYDSHKQASDNDDCHEAVCVSLMDMAKSWSYGERTRELLDWYCFYKKEPWLEKVGDRFHPLMDYACTMQGDEYGLAYCLYHLAVWNGNGSADVTIHNRSVIDWLESPRSIVTKLTKQNQIDWYAEKNPEFDPANSSHEMWPFQTSVLVARVMCDIETYEKGTDK